MKIRNSVRITSIKEEKLSPNHEKGQILLCATGAGAEYNIFSHFIRAAETGV